LVLKRFRFLVVISLLVCALIVGHSAVRFHRPPAVFMALTAVPIFVFAAAGILFGRLERALLIGGTIAAVAEFYYFFWFLAAA
jgi:hypothetical protein